MCQCLSFLACSCPCISERWALWKLELQRLIARIASYNGPFTGLEVQRISISGSLITYAATGAKVHVTLTMGTCTSKSSSCSINATTEQVACTLKRKQSTILRDPASLVSAVPGAPPKSPDDKLRKDLREVLLSRPRATTEISVLKKICTNGSSNLACLFSEQGRKGINQDAMIVWEDFGSQEDAVFCGVFDGHGPHGHLVSQLVRNSLPSMLASSFNTLKSIRLEAAQSETADAEARKKIFKDADALSPVQSLWKEAFFNAYMLMDSELHGKAANVDCYCSGTTAVTLVRQGNDVYIGNVGDSRAIIGTRSDNGSLTAVPLTVDLKPNLPEEAERIRQCRGRVFALQDEPEVHRVWLPHDNSPGLAMARAFGDFCLKNFGVIAVPDVTHRRLTEQDQFIVLATDGVWDVLSNKEVVDIVASVPLKSLAARAVVDMAVHAWRSKFPTSKIDDCAVVCLFTKERVAASLGKNMKKTIVRKRTNSAAAGLKVGGPKGCNKAEPDNSCQGKKGGDVLPSQNGAGSSEKDLKSNGNIRIVEKENNMTRSSVVEGNEWSALDGVTRVNSLVNLPRFTPDDIRAGS